MDLLSLNEDGGLQNHGRRFRLMFLFLSLLLPISVDNHSLFYLYTVQSEDSSHNIYQFSVETLLDDTQMDSYSSWDGIRTPKQSWMKEIKESEWRTGTEKLKYEGQWINKVLQLQLEVFRHKESERHVLQWRNGCEGEKLPDGSVSTLNCINEYGYDGEDLMSYNWTSRQWSVSVKEAQETVEKFNSGSGQDPALICQDCVKWMKVYLQYSPQHTPNGTCDDCEEERSQVLPAVMTLMALVLVLVLICFLKQKRIIYWRRDGGSDPIRNYPEGFTPVPTGDLLL